MVEKNTNENKKKCSRGTIKTLRIILKVLSRERERPLNEEVTRHAAMLVTISKRQQHTSLHEFGVCLPFYTLQQQVLPFVKVKIDSIRNNEFANES